MALHLGNNLMRININGVSYNFKFIFGEPVTLKSSDGYILKDSNGVYLKAKWGE